MASRSDISDTEPIDRNAPTERSVSSGTEPDPRRRTPGARTERQLGRFVLLESLGVGGMGVVLAAYDPELDRNVALKLLHPGPVDDLEGPAKLMREAQAMARLAHPNVVTVYEVGFAREQPFVAMELIDGTTLSVWLAQPRTWRAIIAMFTDAGRGLAAAHAAGLVHRDVKPSNVFVGKDGRARIGDFGLVTARDERGAIAGTPAYMAPEQLDGDADARADQFGFCVALWEALFGARPFGGTTFDEQRRAHRAGPPPVPRGAEVPARIAAAVRRGLAIAPADRWPDMPALLAALAYDPAIARRRLALGGAFAGLAALATWGALRTSATDPCADSAAQLASAWDAGRQEAVRAAF
ncbi:MAG: serine/threonine protein kinase, partial [Deltaproteobacteria bacterium]|nr:serine/threonine protein kinase [Deltaproteobacteria bacterium]